MLEHDICVGAAGTSSWERCALGMPTILLAFAENQGNICSRLVYHGAAKGLLLSFTDEELSKEISYLSNKKNYLNMSYCCLAVCDGKGINRVMLRLINERNQCS